MDVDNTSPCGNELPELPIGKEYHIYLCYSNEDENVARQILDYLEKLGLKCCFHGRDFTPGVGILMGMTKSIEESMYVVILLSENYNNSKLCEHEISMALHSNLEHKTNVIPVKIEPCKIPSTLSHLTYVNRENGNYHDLNTEIFNAIIKQEGTQAEESVKSGKQLRIKPYVYSISRRSVKYKFQKEVRQQFEQIPDEYFDSTEQMINNAWLVRNKILFDYPGRTFFVSILFLINAVIMAVFLQQCICYTGKALPKASKCTSIPVGIDISTLGIMLLSVVCFRPFCPLYKRELQRLRCKTCEDLNKQLWEKLNSSLLWNSHAIICYDKSEVVIMQYNPDPCLSYFCRHEDKFDMKKKHDHESNKDFAIRVFDEFLSQFQHMLLVPNIEEERHKTYNHAPCLCLQVEDWLKK